MNGVSTFTMDAKRNFAELRDASSFIQLQAERGLRSCEFFRDLLQSIRRNVSDCRRSVLCHLTDVLCSFLLLLQT